MLAVDALPWSAPSAPIWSLVSGYASDVRRKKYLVFLQAVTDDSGSEIGDRRLYMAGYLNTAENWALFADAWNDELKTSPPIKYMKMAEANNLGGQFRGWTHAQRDEKLAGLIRVIRHFKPVSFEISINRNDYQKLVSPVAPQGLGNAYFPCASGVMSMVSQFCESEGSRSPIEFIFDHQNGLDDDIALFFDYMKRSIPRKARSLISGSPIFKDDKQFLPIQAADMLAWNLRREHEDGTIRPMAVVLRGQPFHVFMHINEKSIESMAEGFSKIRGVELSQGKKRWREVKNHIRGLLAVGYIPPHGTRWKNALRSSRDFIKRQISRWL